MSKRPLTVSNLLFNTQLNQVLVAGDNVEFELSDSNRKTIVKSKIPQELTINRLANNVTYKKDVLIYINKNIYKTLAETTNINPQTIAPLKYQDWFINPNCLLNFDMNEFEKNYGATIPLNTKQSLLYWSDDTNINYVSDLKTKINKNILGTKNNYQYASLLMDPNYLLTSFDNTNNMVIEYAEQNFNHSKDYTIILTALLDLPLSAENSGPPNYIGGSYLRFTGNSKINELMIGTTAQERDSIVFKCGENHLIKLNKNIPSVYIFRMSGVNNATTVLDVFMNGHLVYSKVILTSTLSQGLGGVLYVNIFLFRTIL